MGIKVGCCGFPVSKAKPKPSEIVKLAARNLGLIKPRGDVLKTLEKIWSAQKVPGKDFCDKKLKSLKR